MVSGDRQVCGAASRQDVEQGGVTALAGTDIDTIPSTVGVSDILKDLMLEPASVAKEVKLPDAALKDADAAKKALMASIPTPNRRRAPLPTPPVDAPAEVSSSAPVAVPVAALVAAPVAATMLPCLQPSNRGPTPWDMPADSGSQSQRYRDQLRVSGQQALQRGWDRGMVPKGSGSNSGASTPSASANPLVPSFFDQVTTPTGQHGMPRGCAPMGPPFARPPHFQSQQQQQQQQQHQQRLCRGACWNCMMPDRTHQWRHLREASWNCMMRDSVLPQIQNRQSQRSTEKLEAGQPQIRASMRETLQEFAATQQQG